MQSLSEAIDPSSARVENDAGPLESLRAEHSSITRTDLPASAERVASLASSLTTGTEYAAARRSCRGEEWEHVRAAGRSLGHHHLDPDTGRAGGLARVTARQTPRLRRALGLQPARGYRDEVPGDPASRAGVRRSELPPPARNADRARSRPPAEVR